MFFRDRRLDNVAGLYDGPLELKLRVLGARSACGKQLRHRPPALQDDHSFSGGLHAIEDRQASGLEVGCVDGFHMTRIDDQTDHVKQCPAAARWPVPRSILRALVHLAG